MQVDYYVILHNQQKAPPELFDYPPQLFHHGRPFWWFESVLENIARELGVTPLPEFVSYSREDCLYTLGEETVRSLETEGVAGEALVFEEQWFEAEQGLKTVHSLLSHLRSFPESLDAAQPGPRHEILVEDLIFTLQNLAEILEQAQQQQTRFRLFKY